MNVLLPRIASGKIEVIGRPFGMGSSKKIDRLNFVGIKIINPLHETNDFADDLLSADPHIVCSFFGDDWAKAGGDKFYQQFVQKPEWTHLQVKKSDVLREITFQIREELPAIAHSSPSDTQLNLSGRGKMNRAIKEAIKEAFPKGIPHGMSSQSRDEKIRERLQEMEGVESMPNKRTIERAIKDLRV